MPVMQKTVDEFQSYEAAVEWVTNLQSFGIRPGLERMEYMMEKLGHPERRIRPIHIAGTNGKGSTCAILSRMLMELGYEVGTFTSPYITKFTNRIQFNGQDIEEEDVVYLLNEIKPLAESLAHSELGSPTMFEVSTALAILYFAKIACPYYVVWETGLGGRLDSTNIIHPAVTVITNVGHDHMDVLGETLLDVAREKSGIMKTGIPLISGATQPQVRALLDQVAQNKKAKHYKLEEQFRVFGKQASATEQTFDYKSLFMELGDLKLTLGGRHQLDNAALALMTIDVLKAYNALIVEEEPLRSALSKVEWPGRLELISGEPPILLDGAHNPEGAEALVNAIKQYFPHRKLCMLIGMMPNKRHKAYIEHILQIADQLIVTEPDFQKKWPADQAAQQIAEWASHFKSTCQITIEKDWKKALDRLQSEVGQDDLAVACGSLYLVADVRSQLLQGIETEKGW